MDDYLFGLGITVTLAFAGATLVAAGWRLAYLGLLTVVLLFQNIVVMALLRVGAIGDLGAQLLLSAKEGLLVVGACSLAVRALPRVVATGRVHRSALPAFGVAWIVFVLVHGIASGPPWLPRLAGARFAALLPALFIVGYWMSLSVREVGKLVKVVFRVAIWLALFGLVEAYVLPDSFWLSIGHEEYYEVKVGRPVQGRLYGNMNYWVSGQAVRRVASITGDPLISSYPLALAIVLLAARYMTTGRFRYTHLLVGPSIAVATLLTLSRGAVLTIVIAVALLAIAGRSRTVFVLLTGAALAGVVVVASMLGDVILGVTTGRGHIDQLVQGIERGIQRPLGYGLGTAGSTATGVARANAADDVVLGGGDSYLGSLATQLGLPATLLFYAYLAAIAGTLAHRFVVARRARVPHSWWYGATAATLAGLIVTSALNESGFGFVASGLTMILAGTLLTPRLAVEGSTAGGPERAPAVRLEASAGVG